MATKHKRVDDIERKLEPDVSHRVIVVWDADDERLAEALARGEPIISIEWDDDEGAAELDYQLRRVYGPERDEYLEQFEVQDE